MKFFGIFLYLCNRKIKTNNKMKKILFLVVTAAAVLTACNGNKQTGNETADSTAVETEQAAPEQAYDLEAIAKVIDGAETVMGFSEGRASVINKDGNLGVIDTKGNVSLNHGSRLTFHRNEKEGKLPHRWSSPNLVLPSRRTVKSAM